MSQTAHEEVFQKSIQLYQAVRSQTTRRLSFAPRGDNGLADASGRISSPLLLEIYEGVSQRLAHVLVSLEERSELPESVHTLPSAESGEAQLVGSICTGYFAWMMSDVIELFHGGKLSTVSPMLDDMIQHVAQLHTVPSTSLKKPARLGSLRLTPTLKQDTILDSELDRPLPPVKKKVKKKKASKPSTKSTGKSPKGKKRALAKKKGRKSGKRSGRKR